MARRTRSLRLGLVGPVRGPVATGRITGSVAHRPPRQTDPAVSTRRPDPTPRAPQRVGGQPGSGPRYLAAGPALRPPYTLAVKSVRRPVDRPLRRRVVQLPS